MDNLKNKLEKFFKQKLTDTSISADIALDSIVEFYKQYKTQQNDDVPENDMLLFQYGKYDYFDGKGELFTLNFTRQIADSKDDEFFQIGLTLYFKIEDIGGIESFNLWSIERPSINDWAETIKNTDGFIKATHTAPYHYTIELNKT